MRIDNVERMLCLANAPRRIRVGAQEHQFGCGALVLPSQSAQHFGFRSDGLNLYHHFTQESINKFKAQGVTTLLSSNDRFILKSLVDWLKVPTTVQTEVTVIWSIEPRAPIANPYSLINKNGEYFTALGGEMQASNALLKDDGKSIRFVIRFAAEMNDSPQDWRRGNKNIKPADFINGYKDVRGFFRAVSDKFQMCFSPAIRADVDVSIIPGYFPGWANVDVVAGSWYYGGKLSLSKSQKNLLAYFRNCAAEAAGKGFTPLYGLDEIGGSTQSTMFWTAQNGPSPVLDADSGQPVQIFFGDMREGIGHLSILPEMFKTLGSLKNNGVNFDYVTLFMQQQWDPRGQVTPTLPIS